MGGWMDLELARQRRRELLQEAERGRLAREAARSAAGEAVQRGVKVRWGLAQDDAAVADVLQLNGMPRWVAFEERFIVAERNGKLVGAVRYATESKKLSLGLLVVDPWAGERRTARALYRGAVDLALDLGAADVVATATRGLGYPGEAGYRRAGRGWRSPVPAQGGGERGGFLRTLVHLWGTRVALPFYRIRASVDGGKVSPDAAGAVTFRSRVGSFDRQDKRLDGCMSARIRHGVTAAATSDAYLDYPNETGVPDYRATEGDRSVYVLHRVENDRAHFLTVSFWEPVEGTKRFAGPDSEKARYYPEDEKFPLDFEPGVEHFDVVAGP